MKHRFRILKATSVKVQGHEKLMAFYHVAQLTLKNQLIIYFSDPPSILFLKVYTRMALCCALLYTAVRAKALSVQRMQRPFFAVTAHGTKGMSKFKKIPKYKVIKVFSSLGLHGPNKHFFKQQLKMVKPVLKGQSHEILKGCK